MHPGIGKLVSAILYAHFNRIHPAGRLAPWEGLLKKEWMSEMRIHAAAVKPLVVLTVASASFGSIAPAYAEDVTVNVTYGVAA